VGDCGAAHRWQCVWNQGLRQTNGNVGIGTAPTTDRLIVGRTDSGIIVNAPENGC
jgi:hypothetical protein